MLNNQDFGIGLIGLGIGQQHLHGYQRKDLHVAAICDKDETRLHEVGDRFGINRRYTRIVDLITDTQIDVIDLAVHPWIRSPIVHAAAQAGKHIFCQKPFSMTMQQAVEMVDTCEKHNVQLMINQNACFVPGFLTIGPYINVEHLGDIYHVSITCNGFYTGYPAKHLIAVMQVHHISLINKWFGEIESVYCQAHGHDRSVEEGETMSVVLFKCRNGVKGLLSCNWSFLANTGHNFQHPHEEIRIQGTKGAIIGNSADMTVYLTEPEIQEIRPEIHGTWFPDAFGNAMVHFLDCLQTEKKPLTDGRSNLHIVQTIFAMYKSALSERVVMVEDISLEGNYDISPYPVHTSDDVSVLS